MQRSPENNNAGIAYLSRLLSMDIDEAFRVIDALRCAPGALRKESEEDAVRLEHKAKEMLGMALAAFKQTRIDQCSTKGMPMLNLDCFVSS